MKRLGIRRSVNELEIELLLRRVEGCGVEELFSGVFDLGSDGVIAEIGAEEDLGVVRRGTVAR